MRLVYGIRRAAEERRGAVAVAGCVATALLLVTTSVVVGQLAFSLFLAALGVPAIMLLTRGTLWTADLVMVVGMFFAPLNSVRVGGPITVADLLFVAGFLLLTPTLLRRRIILSDLYGTGWLVMIVTGLVASAAAVNVAISYNHMIRFMLAALFLPFAFMLWRPPARLLLVLAAAYQAGAAVSVVYAVTLGAGGDRPLGLTTHPNFFGLTSILGAALVPYVVQFIRPRLRWGVWLAGLVCTYGVWISGSRAAFVALGAIVLVYVVRETSVFMALSCGLAGVMLLVFLDRLGNEGEGNALSRIMGGGSAQGSDYERHQAFERAVDAIHAHPIMGNGFEHAMEAHSIYLQVWTSIGVVGLAGYAMVLLAMVLPLLDPRRTHYRLAYPALAYVLVGIVTNSLWDRFVWALLALCLAGVVIDNHERGRHAPVEEQPSDYDEPSDELPVLATGPVAQ